MKWSFGFVTSFLLLFSQYGVGGEIAITFDDAPREDTPYFIGAERTRRLIHNMSEAEVPSTLFFVLGKNVVPQTINRLEAYVAAGHYIANHSFDHLSANKVSAELAITDFDSAHARLSKLYGFQAYYRPPYLHYGDTLEKYGKIAAHVKERNYQIGYVTVDNFDWYMDSLFQKAVASGKRVDHKALGDVYVNTLWESIAFYDRLAIETLGRSPKHVLLLHENDLAALYIGKLKKMLEGKGWKMITPQEAYSDPIAKMVPDTLFNKQGRVAAIAHEKGIPESQLRSAPESTEYLDKLFLDRRVFIDSP